MNKNYSKPQESIVKSIEEDIDFKLYALLIETRDACVKARGNELSQYDISPIESRALFVIQSIGAPATPAEISKYVFREHNTVSALINRMEKKGLITKTRDPKRKNLWRIELTEKGLEVIHQAVKIESIHNFLSSLSKEERVILESFLTRIRLKALQQVARDSILSIPWVAMHNINI